MSELNPETVTVEAQPLAMPGAGPAPVVDNVPVDNRPTQTAEQIWEQRIAAMEAQLQANEAELSKLRAQQAADDLSEEERLKRFNEPYDNPHEHAFVLVLSTGELVGHPNAQSTQHYSRQLQRDVPVRDVIERTYA